MMCGNPTLCIPIFLGSELRVSYNKPTSANFLESAPYPSRVRCNPYACGRIFFFPLFNFAILLGNHRGYDTGTFPILATYRRLYFNYFFSNITEPRLQKKPPMFGRKVSYFVRIVGKYSSYL